MAEPKGKRTNSLTPFLNPETGGLGLRLYNQAKAAGMSASQIATLIPGSGAAGVGDLAQQALQRDIEEEKTSKLREYEAKFESSMQQYRAGLREAQARTAQLSGGLSRGRAAREEAKARAEALEKRRRMEQQYAPQNYWASETGKVSVSRQLSGLRSGSTMGGTPGAGLGSLTSGGSALSGWRSLGRRSEARRRVLTSGGGGSYYASRFG